MKLDKFDENYEMYIDIMNESHPIRLVVSDELYISDELHSLPYEYQKRIINFIENSNLWYSKSVEKIRNEANIGDIDCVLLTIFILSEPDEKELIFGLEFGSSIDIEHNIGMKITEKTLSIIEYGGGDVAFC